MKVIVVNCVNDDAEKTLTVFMEGLRVKKVKKIANFG